MPEPLPMFTPPPLAGSSRLALQASAANADHAATLHTAHGFDVVLTASTNPRQDPAATLERQARRFVELTGQTPELDANRYAGNARSLGATPLDRGWCERQAALGVPRVLTNGGYIDSDVRDVAAAVRLAEEMQHVIDSPVMATIAINSTLLRTEPDAIVDILGGSRVAVGLALGNAGDPLAAKSTVGSLIRVLALGNVELRRVDLSGIGALAFGAPGAAIGTTATLRHIYPMQKGGHAPSPYPSVLVEKSLTWKTQDRVMDAAAVYDDDAFWLCECDTCFGRRIDHALRSEADIVAHNFGVIARIARKVLGSTDPVTTWMQMCSAAQSYSYDIDSSGPNWEPQGFLGAWWANQPTRVGA